jgi:hypothetical protein
MLPLLCRLLKMLPFHPLLLPSLHCSRSAFAAVVQMPGNIQF